MRDRNGKELTNSEVMQKAVNRGVNVALELELYVLQIISNGLPFHNLRKIAFGLAGVKIGKNSYIHMWARFYNPSGITIGNVTIIGDHCVLDGRAPLKIGNNVDIASEVMIYNS